jgi:hypothetical protein
MRFFFFSFAFPNVQNYIWLKYNRYHIDNKKIPANFLFYASIIKIMVFFLLFFFFILIFIINYTYVNKDFNMFNLWGVILTLTLHNNDTTPRHNGVEGKWFLYTKCTINVQHPFIWGGLHTLWGPPHVKGCCTFVVGVMYNYHYSFKSISFENSPLFKFHDFPTHDSLKSYHKWSVIQKKEVN